MALLWNERARGLWTWLGANVVFALCHPVAADLGVRLPAVLQAAGVALALLWLPGAAWSTLTPAGTRHLGARLSVTLAWATAIFLLVIAAFAAVGRVPSAHSLWTTFWVVTNAGFVIGLARRRLQRSRRSLARREVIAAVACGALAFVLFFWGATRVVPTLEDQDLEVAGTGYALLTTAEPLLLNDRNSWYFFAHPPLLHLYVAGAHVLGGAIDDLRVYFDASLRVRDAAEHRVIPERAGLVRVTGHPAPLPVPPGDYRIVRATDELYFLSPVEGAGPAVAVPIAAVELDEIYSHYARAPRLIDARTVNVFFGAVTVALLAVWTGRLTRRAWFGVWLAAVYATSPEVFVRSSYGGYYAIGALACVLMLLAHDHWRRTGALWIPMLVGAGAALADHKLVVLPLVLGVVAMLGSPRSAHGRWSRLHPVAMGFVGGTLLFWLWGFGVAPGSFVADHLRGHLLDRVLHHNPFGYGGYPTVTGLWREFIGHTGYILLPAALLSLAVDSWRRGADDARGQASGRMVWILWIVATAVVFSVVDWRMTKHLALIVIPLLLALAPPRGAAPWRVVAAAGVLAVVLAFNVKALMGLAADFASVVVTPGW